MPFVGRDREIQTLRSAFRDAASGRSRIVLVTGDPGVGKTRLLHELLSSVGNPRCLVGRGSPLAGSVPFSVLAEAMQSALRTLGPDAIHDLFGPSLADLAIVLPAAAAAWGSVPDAPSSRLGLVEALAGAFEAIAGGRPLVVELDDLHQADPSTWEVLAYVGRNPLTAPVLIVAAMRTAALLSDPELGRLVDALRTDGLADELRLAPLDRTAVDELAIASLGATDATAELTGWLFDRSRGNALFTVALLEELAADPERRIVPASVKERVRVAVGTLEAGPRAILEAAAVLGHAFTYGGVASLVDDDLSGLDALVVGGFLTERLDGTTAQYDFVHPLVQEAVYENLGAARRVALHRRAAMIAAGGVTVRAYHAARGAVVGDAEALAVILEAARVEEQRQAHREALTHLRAALALTATDDSERRIPLLDEIAWQAAEASDHGVGLPALRELEGLVAHDPVALGTTEMRLASFLATGAGDLVAAAAAGQEAVRLFGDSGANDRIPGALNELAWIRGEGGDLEAQVRMSGEAIASAEAAGDIEAVMHAQGAHAHGLALLGRTVDAVAASRRGLAIAIDRDERAQIAWHTGALADAFVLGGRPSDGAAVVDPLFAEGPMASDVAYFSRARANWFLGRWAEALADCRAIQAMHPTMPSIHSAWTLSLAAMLLAATGDASAKEPYLAEADRAYGERHFYAFSVWNDWAQGCARWWAGDPDAGHVRLVRAADGAHRLGSPPVAAEVMPDAVMSSVRVGDLALARHWAAALADHAPATPMTQVASDLASGIFADAEGDRTRAADALGAAAAGAREIPAPFIAARALEHLGDVVDPAAAVEPLAEAARLYASLPAPSFEARTIARLRAIGPIGRRASQNVGELTAREREVALLARSGLSSKQIAGRLQLSERTIESHLAHVYRKLRIDGRQELGSWDPDPDPRA